MKKNRWFAFMTAIVAVTLLVGNTSNASAQAEKDLPDCPPDATAVKAPPPAEPALPPQPAPPPPAPAEDPCLGCKKELSDTRQQLDGALKLLSDKKSADPAAEHSADWHWGLGGKFGLLPGQKAGLSQIYGMGRWIPGKVGVESILALGVWPTSDGSVSSAPFAGSIEVAGVLELAKEAQVFIGLGYSKMRKPYKNKPGWVTDVELIGGASIVFGNFQIRVSTGPSVYSTFERLHGWWIGLELGYYH